MEVSGGVLRHLLNVKFVGKVVRYCFWGQFPINPISLLWRWPQNPKCTLCTTSISGSEKSPSSTCNIYRFHYVSAFFYRTVIDVKNIVVYFASKKKYLTVSPKDICVYIYFSCCCCVRVIFFIIFNIYCM